MNGLTRVKLSNLDKILYPELRLTKADIIKYYIQVAPLLLPFLRDRALVRTRYPDGITGEGFYEKDMPKGAPEWVQSFTKYSASVDKDTSYVVCNDLDTLIWLANLAALELHIPLSKINSVKEPDLLLFDIDPAPPAGLNEAIHAAIILKEHLEAIGLKPFVKTSGKKGLHVVIPIRVGYNFKQTSSFVHAIAIVLASRHDFIVSERSQTLDPGTVLIDYPQNSERGTMISPYCLRALREATVSAPLEWRDLVSLRPFDYNFFNVIERKEDPWMNLFQELYKLSVS
ncbi:MAG: non-homologous end-joining DNA ligase [Promethearchaeota archaeon]|jgi:bifunctional non-homologous end joining protein LigD